MRALLLILAVTSLTLSAFAADKAGQTPDVSLATGLALSGTVQENTTDGPSGFLGIPWGSKPALTMTEMAKRPGVILVRQAPDELLFAGGTCAGVPVEIWRYRFENGNFYQSSVSFEFPVEYNEKGSVSDKINDALRDVIVKRYGGDGTNDASSEHNLQTWSFPETAHSKGEKTIQLNYSWQAGAITLTYTNLYYQSLASPTKVTPGDL